MDKLDAEIESFRVDIIPLCFKGGRLSKLKAEETSFPIVVVMKSCLKRMCSSLKIRLNSLDPVRNVFHPLLDHVDLITIRKNCEQQEYVFLFTCSSTYQIKSDHRNLDFLNFG